MFYDPEANNGTRETGKTVVLFQGVTMDFGRVFAQSNYVQDTVKHLQNIWQKRGICELDLVQICANPNYPPKQKTMYEQPAIFAVSLAKLWEVEKTCEPQVFLGHSFGEYAAVCASGVVRPEDGYRATQFRGQLACAVNYEHPGCMAALNGPFNILSIQRICQIHCVDIANINSPEQIVISGEYSPVEKASKEFEQEGLRVIPLETGAPFHSRHFAAKQPVLREFLRSIPFHRPQKKLLMNATASLETDPQRIKECLVKLLTDPVDFLKTITAMNDLGVTRIEEIGSRNILKGFVKKTLKRP